MKQEKIDFNKLETIQMRNFLMKKELTLKLIEDIDLNHKTRKYKQKYKFLINFFIEDLFNIMNQQILTYTQIYESTDESKIENLIFNNKNISFNMILNFFNKIYSFLKEKIKSNNVSRNHISHKLSEIKKCSYLIDKNISGVSSNDKTNFKECELKRANNSNILEEKYFRKKYKTNLNSVQNSIQNSKKKSRKNSSGYIKNILLNNNNNSYSSQNLFKHKNNKSNNIKPYYVNLNKLNDSEGKDIEVFIKSNKTKKNEYEHFLTGKKEFSIISKKNSKKYVIRHQLKNIEII